MLKIDRGSKALSELQTPSLSEAAVTERYDLQECILNSSDAFFRELGEDLFLLKSEFQPSTIVQDRIDVLAIARDGAIVVIELKRGNNKLQLLQAVSYAGMIAKWTSDELLSQLIEVQQAALEEFLDVEADQINFRQRIVLIAEAFDYSLLISAEWLSECYGVDISCARVSMALDTQTGAEYLSCAAVYPTPELAQSAIPRGQRTNLGRRTRCRNWDDALQSVSNESVRKYFEEKLEADTTGYLPKRTLRIQLQNRHRWNVEARMDRAYVWQKGRFEDDIAFWQKRLSEPDLVQPVKGQTCLRFYLATEADFHAFDQAVGEEFDRQQWLPITADA